LKTATRLAVAVAACGVVLLTACSPLKAGAAAIVGQERITTAEVDKRVQEVQAALNGVPGAKEQMPRPLPQSVLLQLVETNRFRQVGAKNGIRVTDGEIDAFVANQGGGQRQVEQQLLVQGVPPSQSRDYVRAFLTGQKLIVSLGGGTDEASVQRGQQALAKQVMELPVTFSPRYGTWDQQQGAFLPAERFGKAKQQQGAPEQGGPQQGVPQDQMPQGG
jgi:peptidyl-prolyl cis-trans isomerase SurA